MILNKKELAALMMIEAAIYGGRVSIDPEYAELLKGIIDRATAEHEANIKRAIANTKEKRKTNPLYGYSKKQLEERAKAAEKRKNSSRRV